MDSIDYRSLPAVLLAATWAAFDVVIKTVEILNKRKDEVIRIAHETSAAKVLPPGNPIEVMENIIHSDYLLMTVGITAFCAVFALLVWKIPKFYVAALAIEPGRSHVTLRPQVRRSMEKACNLVAFFALIGVMSFVVGGASDIQFMQREVEKAREAVNTLTTPKAKPASEIEPTTVPHRN